MVTALMQNRKRKGCQYPTTRKNIFYIHSQHVKDAFLKNLRIISTIGKFFYYIMTMQTISISKIKFLNNKINEFSIPILK